ncbi:MAG TPA: hypothetical protein VKP58_08925 [Candidatus Acidoferrum sp.]|nr:hypothetical protein [Candidatus Acidoferrum sp.]
MVQNMNNSKIKPGLGEKAKAGRVMLWLGAIVLLGEAWMLLAQINEFWQGSGAAALGWTAAVGAAVQKAATFLVWGNGVALAVAAKVLVLCCPLLAIGVGMGLMRSAQLAQAGEFAAKSARAEEERP